MQNRIYWKVSIPAMCRHLEIVSKDQIWEYKCRHLWLKCRYLDAMTIFFERCKCSKLALNDFQPHPMDLSTSRPLDTSLQQYLEVEQQDYNMN